MVIDTFYSPSTGSSLLPVDTYCIYISYRFLVIQLAPKAFPSAHPSDPDTMTITALEAIASSDGKNQA